MRILLVRPQYRGLYKLIKANAKKNLVVPPLGLLYVAAMLEKSGEQVEIIDGEIESFTIRELALEAVKRKPDLIGVGATSVDFHLAKIFAEEIKKCSDITVILGGPHATVLPDKVLQENSCFDFLVRGEGEVTSVELVRVLKNSGKAGLKSVLGISYKMGRDIIHNPDRPLFNFQKDCVWPARHLLKLNKYMFPSPKKGMRQMTVVQATRGCPFGCIYCYKMFGHVVRQRSISDVLAELKYVVRDLGCERVSFVDDTFTLDSSRVIELCEGIVKEKLKFGWICLARADTINTAMVKAMKAAGCDMISMGVESGNDAILKAIGKGENRADFVNAFSILHNEGMTARASFILGLPGEARETIEETIRFSQELRVDRAFFNICTPYPKTLLWDIAENGQALSFVDREFEYFTRWGNSVIELPGISAVDLKAYQRKAMIDFYCRPKIIFKHLTEFLSGNAASYYYRPLLFAIREKLKDVFSRIKSR
ncbi:MAG: hypothetical protein AUJ70_00115 [Candidatus Omnitrophica bacterium CG1_02_40_15]|nr:MAG: hypothetical protein AUJ70_00115 [Candidatus Omnitrophica bacterium CG1_02_40_15]